MATTKNRRAPSSPALPSRAPAKRKGYTLSCEIKGLKFEAEGDRTEVLAKFDEFVQQAAEQIKAAMTTK